MPLEMMTSCALRVSSIQNLQEKVKQKQNKNKFNSFFFCLGAQEDVCLRNCQKGKCMTIMASQDIDKTSCKHGYLKPMIFLTSDHLKHHLDKYLLVSYIKQ